jgi:hypothetical protein
MYLAVNDRSIMPLKPKNMVPMLAARGSPSNVELTDQAMQKRISKMPMLKPPHTIQFRWKRFDNLTRTITETNVKTPRQNHVIPNIYTFPP